MRSLRLFLCICLLVPGLLSARIFARWHTSMGSFTAELYDEIVPITAHNFRDLATAGFYNNLIFHRVIEGFVIQDGCPNGTGTGGPGYTIPDEISPLLNHNEAGILAMARTSAPNSAGSQYYFTLAPTPHLNGSYAVFGKCIEGLEYILGIGSVLTDADDRPIIPVDIYQVRMLDLTIGQIYPPEDEVIVLDTATSQMFICEAYTQSAELSYSWYVDDVLQSETSFLFETTFPVAGDHSVHCHIASSDSIAQDVNWSVQSSTSASDASITPLISMDSSPNPFGQQVDISYGLKEAADVSLTVFNQRGQVVRTMALGYKSAGNWLYTWDGLDGQGSRCPAGRYLLMVESGKHKAYRKVLKL
ncbi:MAG TPA: peptidylprolyl isomerase [Candidatus Cloacimonadota bacterium]|nr:peptidylprolyl isomerase [Candidatus Cloacimonadota bacterium]